MKRKTIYTALKKQAYAKMTYLKVVDLQKGQFKKPRKNYPLPMPCLLIEFSDFNFSNDAEYTQEGDGIISFHLYLNFVGETFAGSESEEDTIELLDNMDDIFQSFEGFALTNMAPLDRVHEHKPVYGDKYIQFQVDFTTNITDSQTLSTTTMKGSDITPDIKFKF